MSAVPVAEIVRNGFVEGHHYGSLVTLDRDGGVGWSVGDVRTPTLPRSCNKPIQALGMIRLGLDLPPELVALACASHSGEPFHVEGVRAILESAGLGEDALRNPPAYPLDDTTREQLIRDGRGREPVFMDCSGKHAAMLATCVTNGWPTADYLDPGHPLQQGLAATFTEMTGEPIEVMAVDGCGAPLFSTSLVGLAVAFRRLALGLGGSDRPDAAAARIASAIRVHPAYVSGTTRDELALLTAMPGAIGKTGAEGCYAVALADGRAVALKTDDGAERVRPALMAEAIDRAGWLEDPAVDAEAVRRTGIVEVLGGGVPVGKIRAAF